MSSPVASKMSGDKVGICEDEEEDEEDENDEQMLEMVQQGAGMSFQAHDDIALIW